VPRAPPELPPVPAEELPSVVVLGAPPAAALVVDAALDVLESSPLVVTAPVVPPLEVVLSLVVTAEALAPPVDALSEVVVLATCALPLDVVPPVACSPGGCSPELQAHTRTHARRALLAQLMA